MQYTTSGRAKGICPEGWHLPSREEFEILADEVGDYIPDYGDYSGGNALKAIGQCSGSGAGTNTSGFSALLAGRWSEFHSTFDLFRFLLKLLEF